MHAGVPPSLVDRVHAGIDDLLATDLATVDDRSLCAATVELYRAEARLTAARARLLAEVDRREAYRPVGAQTAAAYVTKECRVPGGVARHQVMTARALVPPPGDLRAAGRRRHQRVARLPHRVVLDATSRCASWPSGTTRCYRARPPGCRSPCSRRCSAYWLQLADPDGTEEDAEARRARRRLHLSRTLDGCFKLDGLFDPVDGAAIDTALRRIDAELFKADRG